MTEQLPPPTASTGPTGAPGTAGRWYDVPVSRDPADDAVAGVVSGLSRAYGFDVRTTRIAVVLAGIVAFPVVVLAYLAGWLLLPATPADARSLRTLATDRRRLPLYVALAAVAVVFGVGSIGSWFVFGAFPWPLALIAAGILLWAAPGIGGRRDDGHPAPARPAPPTPDAGTTASGFAPPTTSAFGSPTTADTTVTVTNPPTPAVWTSTTAPVGPVERRRTVPIVAATVLAVFTWLAVTRLGVALGWWEITTFAALAVAGIALTAGALVAAMVNRTWALVVPAVLLGSATIGLVVVEPNLDGGIGERRVVATAEQSGITNRLAVGDLAVDLSRVVTSGGTTEASVGLGRLQVQVPADATVTVAASVGAGVIRLDGEQVAEGFRQQVERVLPGTGPSMTLDLDVGAGEVHVIRVESSD